MKKIAMSALLATTAMSSFTVMATETDNSSSQFKPSYHHTVKSEKASMVTSCQIQITNNSYDSVNIRSVYTSNGDYVEAFRIPVYDSSHYIDMYHYGYCNPHVFITVFSRDYQTALYTGYWNTNVPMIIQPGLNNKAIVKPHK